MLLLSKFIFIFTYICSRWLVKRYSIEKLYNAKGMYFLYMKYKYCFPHETLKFTNTPLNI